MGTGEEIFMPINKALNAIMPDYIWGNWIVRKSIIIFTGVGGTHKTTLGYDLALSLQEKGEFLGIEGIRPNVMYVDLESSDSLIKSRLNLIGKTDFIKNNPNAFLYCNIADIKLNSILSAIRNKIVSGFCPDILFLDPLSMISETPDEKNNTDATAKMEMLRDFVNETNICLILMHHPAKDANAKATSTNYGRGQGAWSNLADIVWNIETLNDNYGSDLSVLHIPKNRYCNDGFKQCLHSVEGEIESVPFPQKYIIETGTGIGGFKTFELQENILSYMIDTNKLYTTKDIMKSLELGKESDAMLHRAINALLQRGFIEKKTRGVYTRLL